MALQLASCRLAPTWNVVFLEDGEVLLSDPFDILQGDVVDFTADAFHRILGCSRDMGATLPPQVLQTVLEKTPDQDIFGGQRTSAGLEGNYRAVGFQQSWF
jgi:hypothetical protein